MKKIQKETKKETKKKKFRKTKIHRSLLFFFIPSFEKGLRGGYLFLHSLSKSVRRIQENGGVG